MDRFHQVLEPVPAGRVRDRLELVGARLAGALDAVRALCVEAQRSSPSAGFDVPGGDAAELHHRVSRAATLVAQAAEAATLARVALRSGRSEDAADAATAAERAADQVEELLR